MMRNKRWKHRLLALFVLVPAIVSVSCIFARAETYPDISGLGKMYVLSGNRQFFSRPGGGWILVSSSSTQTMITPLLANGTPDCSAGTGLPFVFQAAAAGGDWLYLSGNAASPANCLLIYRYGMAAGSILKNITPPVSCDFSRGMKTDASGNVLLVTVPYGDTLSSASPFVAYRFVAQNGATCTGVPVQEPASSASLPVSSESASSAGPASSEVSSAAPSSSSAVSSASSEASSAPGVPPQVYRFSSAVTVEQLRQTLAEQNLGETVFVTAPDGSEATAGPVGTGYLFTVSRSGRPDRTYSAVIPGDLTGAGAPDEASRALLYAHINNRAALSGTALNAADLNGDGTVDTADLLLLKKLTK